MSSSKAGKVSHVTPPSGQPAVESLQHLFQSHIEPQDGTEEVRSSSTDLQSENSQKVCPSPYTSPVCEPNVSSSSVLPTDLQIVSVPSNQESDDSQNVNVLLYSDPSSIGYSGESTTSSNGEVPTSILSKIRCYVEAARERNDHRRALLGSRPNPPAQLSEGRKHPEGIGSTSLGICKADNFVPRSPCIIYTDTTEEQIIDTENKVMQKEMKDVREGRGQDPNITPLSEKCLTPGCETGRKSRSSVSEIKKCKEIHNLRERYHRRRIRLCCDELNMLVPFCDAETDKATTLQWTTAYLKYIKEVYGDSPKQAFQNTFCGKTGVRIEPSGANEAPECQNSASHD